MELLTILISRLSITCIGISLRLPGPVVKPRPLTSLQVIPVNKTLATRQQKCFFKIIMVTHCKIIDFLAKCNICHIS